MSEERDREERDANSYIPFDSTKREVEIKPSKIKDAGQGLFAKKFIRNGEQVVVYHGSKMTDEDVFSVYQEDPARYQEMNTVIRGTPNGYAILGEKCDIPVLQGVYVNDIACISCNKEDICREVLQKYADTAKQCNLETIDTTDFPVYVARRRIKKGEELYAHYGIGYWLLHLGFNPEELNVMNQIYRFSSFYK